MDNNGPQSAPASGVGPEPGTQMNANQAYPMGQYGAMPAAGTTVYPNYPNTMQGTRTQVIVAAPAMNFPLSAYQVTMICPRCQQNITTETRRRVGCATHIAAGVICIVGFYLCCCFIPYCVNCCKDVEHKCPNCGNFIGVYTVI